MWRFRVSQAWSPPDARPLHGRANALDQLGVATQPRAHPAREAYVALAVGAALFLQLGDPAVGVAVVDAHEEVIAEEVRDRRTSAGRHSANVLEECAHGICLRHSTA